MQRIFQLSGLILLLSVASCKKGGAENSKVLARVHSDYLTMADIDKSQFGDALTREDTAVILTSFINNWVREHLLLHEAKNNAGGNEEEIKKLVQNYYNSLLIQQYENALVQEQMDSTLSARELDSFYNANKAQNILEENMIRCYFIKAKNTTQGLDQIRRMWRPNSSLDHNSLMLFCNANQENVVFSLDENKWVKTDYLTQILPKEALNGSADYIGYDDENTYFLRVFESASAGMPAPVSYIARDLTDILLYKRKAELLEKMNKQLFQYAKEHNQIEIFQ